MALFTVDRTKCKRDGVCVAECPAYIMRMKSKDDFPSPVAGAEAMCINCGHCVSVCPHGAISLEKMKTEECLPVQKERLPGPDQVQHFLMSRRSIRSYKDQAVDRAVMTRLIDMAGYAPSGHNVQPVNWLVIEDRGEVRRLSGLVIDWMRYMLEHNPHLALPSHFDNVVASWERGKDRICRDAPHVVVAHAAKAVRTAPADCIIALAYLELAAFSVGLGSCWAGFFGAAAADYPPLVKALDLPEGHQVFGALMIGYPRHQYHRIPLRNKPAIMWR